MRGGGGKNTLKSLTISRLKPADACQIHIFASHISETLSTQKNTIFFSMFCFGSHSSWNWSLFFFQNQNSVFIVKQFFLLSCVQCCHFLAGLLMLFYVCFWIHKCWLNGSYVRSFFFCKRKKITSVSLIFESFFYVWTFDKDSTKILSTKKRELLIFFREMCFVCFFYYCVVCDMKKISIQFSFLINVNTSRFSTNSLMNSW